jgi:hypothetical protein
MTDHQGTMSDDAPGVAGGGRPGHLPGRTGQAAGSGEALASKPAMTVMR